MMLRYLFKDRINRSLSFRNSAYVKLFFFDLRIWPFYRLPVSQLRLLWPLYLPFFWLRIRTSKIIYLDIRIPPRADFGGFVFFLKSPSRYY